MSPRRLPYTPARCRPPLPRVLCSSVIRSVHQGESHGGSTSWTCRASRSSRSWIGPTRTSTGKGVGDRGLQGIAFHDGLVYLAASDEVFVYDRAFRRQGSFRNRYLKHCHEINVADDHLYLASTGHDSVLEFDLRAGSFSRAWMLRYGSAAKAMKRVGLRPRPRFEPYDPNGPGVRTPRTRRM